MDNHCPSPLQFSFAFRLLKVLSICCYWLFVLTIQRDGQEDPFLRWLIAFLLQEPFPGSTAFLMLFFQFVNGFPGENQEALLGELHKLRFYKGPGRCLQQLQLNVLIQNIIRILPPDG